MSDQTSKSTGSNGSARACDRPQAGIPWLAMGLAAGAALGAGAGSLAWGLGVGGAIGLGLQQAYRKKPDPAEGTRS